MKIKMFARKCDNCNKGMNEGYLWESGYACSDKCLYVDGYTKKHFEEDYKADRIYYTEWEELDNDYYFLEDGTEIEL